MNQIKSGSMLIPMLVLALTINAQKLDLPIDTSISSVHEVTVNGKRIPYIATTGTQPVWNEAGNPVATLHYTYYRRSDIEDVDKRPLLISFNGGPGSASVWMHLAYTGPRILNIDDEGFPVQPYGTRENPYSILDVADIVYVNPVNTGYSRTIPLNGDEVDREQFFGIRADIKYLAEWLNTFVSRQSRWNSPKFLIGESYGGVRVSGLALELQEKHWMYLNGVILVSPADYNIYISDAPISAALDFPYFTAAAWYHKMLPASLQGKDLIEILPEVEEFTISELIPALVQGYSIPESKRAKLASRMATYTGLSESSILQHNLAIPSSFFWKELLRDSSGLTIGRLDSRYLGLDKTIAGSAPDYAPEITSWLHSFTPPINNYFREHLGFRTDIKYNMFGPVSPWDREEHNTREDLRKAMAENPYLNVLFQVGYYDGATTYFGSKYSMWQLDPGGRMSDRLHFRAYRSGHMMYLRAEDLKASTNDLRSFIMDKLPGEKPAKY